MYRYVTYAPAGGLWYISPELQPLRQVNFLTWQPAYSAVAAPDYGVCGHSYHWSGFFLQEAIGISGMSHIGQGLVNVPFWEYWTSPCHYRPLIPNGWVMWKMGTFNDPCWRNSPNFYRVRHGAEPEASRCRSNFSWGWGWNWCWSADANLAPLGVAMHHITHKIHSIANCNQQVDVDMGENKVYIYIYYTRHLGRLKKIMQTIGLRVPFFFRPMIPFAAIIETFPVARSKTFQLCPKMRQERL